MLLIHAPRGPLTKLGVLQAYGFLATKMRTEYYWWEVVIEFRRVLLVTATKFSDGQRLPCSLINLFVAVSAFGLQLYFLPFANTDANVAEALPLLATILILILGLAQKTKEAEDLTDAIDLTTAEDTDDFLKGLNVVIYVVMFGMVGASIFIVLRRLRGAMYNWQHLSLLEDAEADGRQVSDEVRQMLHKKWLLVASTWAATEVRAPSLVYAIPQTKLRGPRGEQASSPDEDVVLKTGDRCATHTLVASQSVPHTNPISLIDCIPQGTRYGGAHGLCHRDSPHWTR